MNLLLTVALTCQTTEGAILDSLPYSFKRPTCARYDSRGALFVTELAGRIWVVREGEKRLYYDKLSSPLYGVAVRGDTLFVSQQGKIARIEDLDGDYRADRYIEIAVGFPSYGEGNNNQIVYGPDGWLYVGQGAFTSLGNNEKELSASVLRLKPDGSKLEIFAKGLREPFGLAFNGNGELFVTETGVRPCSNGTLDELNLVVRSGYYGFPGGGGNPPLFEFPCGTSPRGLAFYSGDGLGEDYRETILVAAFGESYDNPGLEGLYLLSRWKDGWESSGVIGGIARPIDVTVSPDGAVLVVDFARGKLYRVAKR